MTRALNFFCGFLTVLIGWLISGVIAAPIFLMIVGLCVVAAGIWAFPAIVFFYFIRTMIGA